MIKVPTTYNFYPKQLPVRKSDRLELFQRGKWEEPDL